MTTNKATIPVKTSGGLAKTIEGVVIGLDIGEWAGFEAGRITIKDDSETRIEFRYGKLSIGTIPKIGEYVNIEYTGNIVFQISTIKILDHERVTIADRVSVKYAGLILIAGRPKSAVVAALTQFLIGIGVLLLGIWLAESKPAALSIFGTIALAQFCFAYLVWEYTSS